MDALALLCTLHADGPATWRRLRESDCHALSDLARLQPAELAEILGGTLASAKRFLREARHLEERVGGNWLEHEEQRPVPAAGAGPAASQAADGARAETLPARDQQILDEVLRAWRDEDERESGADEEDSCAAQPEAPTALAATPHEDELVPGALEGLDAAACERLRGAGVRTSEELLAAELGELALRAGLGFSRLYRWRALAARRRRAEPVASERISPAEAPGASGSRDLLQIPARAPALQDRTPRWSPVEEGAAGPFA